MISRKMDQASRIIAEKFAMDSGLKRMLITCGSAILAGFLSGCGSGEEPTPETVPVHGTVTYKGKPVPKGTITFQSSDGRPAIGEIQPDGTFDLSTFGQKDGAVPGPHKVMVVANTGDPTKMPSSPGYVPPKDLVPPKYANITTSGLETTVSKDKTTYDFDLK